MASPVVAIALAVALCGCQRELVATPFVLDGDPAAFDGALEPHQGSSFPIFYITDRAVEREGSDGPVYRYGRSKDLALGTAMVSMSPSATWAELVADSTTTAGRRDYRLGVGRVERAGQLTHLATRLTVVDGRLVLTEEARAQALGEVAALNETLRPWTDAGATDALVYVHGFNNTFEDAVLRTAELWHFTGRRMVPICYTWPAGSGLSIQGYSHDRESSEFTVLHMKMLLFALAENPAIERVHIVSHSRGTDVATSAVRELYMRHEQGAGEPIRDRFKLATLVLAAPDLDLQVFTQRFFAENAAMAPGRFVVYFSRRDTAVGMSDWLFRSGRRLGRFRVTDLTDETSATLARLPSIELIDCDVRAGSSHSYVFDNPAALSDLVLILRDGAAAAEPARPLSSPRPGVWRLDDGYLRPGGAD